MLQEQLDNDLNWIGKRPQAKSLLEDILVAFYENNGREPYRNELEELARLCRCELDPVEKIKNIFLRLMFYIAFLFFVFKSCKEVCNVD